MNLYHKKQRWKIVLLAFAIILVALSLWVSNRIVKRVAEREKERVEQWADAVKRKADLVNLTNNAFEELRENERTKVELWAKALVEGTSMDLPDFTFVLAVIEKTGKDIPLIITSSDNIIEQDYNLEFLDSAIASDLAENNLPDTLLKIRKRDSMEVLINKWSQTHEPLRLKYYGGKYLNGYYYDSQKLLDLEIKKDSLFTAFNRELIENEYLVPVLFIDQESQEVLGTNMPDISEDSLTRATTIRELKAINDPILVDLGDTRKGIIYFEHSPELTLLKYFPIVQFIIIGLFILIGYVIFSTFRKAEQDQVWAGMAKETAHQLGTPISSLMAWIQLLEAQGVEPDTIVEMNKDVDRLNTITNRFSKIGSKAVLNEEDIVPILEHSVGYLRHRISNQIELNLTTEQDKIECQINPSLLEWVIENITKNAVDAMEGKGIIDIHARQFEDEVIIEISDTGKGIPQSKLKTVFQPGYTTKTRGWGLGLSLVKRIIEEFHKGKIYVSKSEVNVGTTFRIVLKVN